MDNKIKLPLDYTNYVFDLYGTLVDIRTWEGDENVWKKLSLFFGYYDAQYKPQELQKAYFNLVAGREKALKKELQNDAKYAHEASPEIEICDVFRDLYLKKGVTPSEELVIHTGQLFRVLSTEYVKLYRGTERMLEILREQGKKVYLLSNAQRIFTEYEMHVLGIAKYFDGILISSDFKTKKPDKRFFDILVERYALNPAETLFIGNDSRSDIAGAKTVNFDTFYVKSNISPQGDKAPDADYKIMNFRCW